MAATSDFIPQIIRPLSESIFLDLVAHVREIRRVFDWPGNPYHDASRSPQSRFNRWYWHNLPVIRQLHVSDGLNSLVEDIFGRRLKPSYSFLSMYGPDGVCPPHTDVPQCQFTMDLLISGAEGWPLYINGKPYVLSGGDAICYLGTSQIHYRAPMHETPGSTHANLAFFHWVPATWSGELDPRLAV
jgi:hypothetical protein